MTTPVTDMLGLLLGVGATPPGQAQDGADAVSLEMLFGEAMRAALGRGQVPGSDQSTPSRQVPKSATPTSPRIRSSRPTALTVMPGITMPTQVAKGAAETTIASVEAARTVRPSPGRAIPAVWDFDAADVLRDSSDTRMQGESLQPTADATYAAQPVEALVRTRGGVIDMPVVLPAMMISAMAVANTQTTDRPVAVQSLEIGTQRGLTEMPLKSGAYQIRDFAVTGDQVTMHLISEDDPTSTIKVVLPVAKFEGSAVKDRPTTGAPARVMLDGMPAAKSMTTLFEDVRLKELVITQTDVQTEGPEGTADAKTVNNAGPTTEVKLFAENAGQEVVLKAVLNSREIRGKTPADVVRRGHSAAVPDESTSAQQPVASRAAVPVIETERQRLVENLVSKKIVLPGANGRAMTAQMADSGGNVPAGAAMPELKDAATGIPREQSDRAPVRFTLPENIRQALRPNGQSVQMQIEPEHLGPARLSLTMKHNQLRALVVVDTPQAKQAVEGSLDRLVDALHRVDVKVDQIQVTVDQNGARNEMFAQPHAQWGRAARFARFSEMTEEPATVTPAAVVAMAGRREYVGAAGVNILA